MQARARAGAPHFRLTPDAAARRRRSPLALVTRARRLVHSTAAAAPFCDEFWSSSQRVNTRIEASERASERRAGE